MIAQVETDSWKVPKHTSKRIVTTKRYQGLQTKNRFGELDPDGDALFIGGVGDQHQNLMDIGFKFQVTDVKKPLLAVKRIKEGGNLVQFGPEEKDNFIMNIGTKDKVYLREDPRGTFVLDAMFPDGSWTEITVDSGAAENVCPSDWAQGYSIQLVDDNKKMKFVGPNGSPIQHYGSKDVFVKTVSSVF